VTERIALGDFSESDDSDLAMGGRYEAFYVVPVTGEDHSFVAQSHGHDDCVHDVRGFRYAQETACFVSVALAQRHDQATFQKTPELGLSWRSADLGDDRCGNQGNGAQFEAGLVFRPCAPLASVGGNENGGVVEKGRHAGSRPVMTVVGLLASLRVALARGGERHPFLPR